MFRFGVALLLLSSLVVSRINGQELDHLGVDESPLINNYEAEFLNKTLVKQGDRFDFTDTKVAFITGSAGTKIIDKKHYFEKLVLPWVTQDLEPQTFFKKLSPEEKEQSGGYDAMVFAWVKWYTDKKKASLVKRLGKMQ